MKRRIAKLTGPKTFEFFEEDLPELKSDEILLKMVSAGLCHSDIHQRHGKKSSWI